MQNEYNFDCPDAFDVDCIVKTLRRLKEGKSVEIPVYNFTTHKAEKKKARVLACFIFVYLLQKICCCQHYLYRKNWDIAKLSLVGRLPLKH